jgi:hypothetical protein
MCDIPKMIVMRPAVVANPIKTTHGTLIIVMECPEYAVRVALYTRHNGEYEQVWLCDDAPGWFHNWADLRARILGFYFQTCAGH